MTCDQLRSDGPQERFELGVDRGRLGFELLDPSGQASQSELGGGEHVALTAGPQPGAAGDELPDGQVPQFPRS